MTRYEARVLIDLAGESAALHAARPGVEGWRRHRTLVQLICYHESGHAIVGEKLGWFTHWVIINKTALAGRALVTPTLEGGGSIQPFAEGPGPSDIEHIHTYCSLLSDDEHWESLRDSLRVQVNGIVEREWLAITALAAELDRKGVILRPEILEILETFSASVERLGPAVPVLPLCRAWGGCSGPAGPPPA